MAPRLSAKTKPQSASIPQRPTPGIGDNAGPSGEEYERVCLISYVSRIVAERQKVETAKAPYETAKKSLNSMFKLAKAALPETSREELERRIKEMESPTRDMAKDAARENRHRRWLGILDADQHALMLGDTAPAEAKDEAHWKGEGYKAGLRQLERGPPTECAERFVQPWMQEYDRGLKEVLEANAPKATRPSVREQAAKDFEADTAAQRAAERREERKAKAALESIGTRVGSEIVDNDPLGANASFEASPEELGAQIMRPAPEDETVV